MVVHLFPIRPVQFQRRFCSIYVPIELVESKAGDLFPFPTRPVVANLKSEFGLVHDHFHYCLSSFKFSKCLKFSSKS